MLVFVFNEKLREFRKQPEINKLIFLYRYISLVFTSSFYFFGVTNHTIIRKLFIILCITVSSAILGNLYIKSKGAKDKILLLIIIETLGNIILLIPSGGIGSPYIWYCVNTILIASVELKSSYCWFNFSVYLLVVNWIAYMESVRTKAPLSAAIGTMLDTVLGFVLVTVAIRLLTRYYSQLSLANRKVKKSMEYIMELYQTISLFSTQNNREQLFELVNRYAAKITQSGMVFFYTLSREKQEIIITTESNNAITQKQLEESLSKFTFRDEDFEKPFEIDILGRRFLLVFVNSNYMSYGILGIDIMHLRYSEEYTENIEQLKILSGLCAIVLEKIELEKVNGRLLIAEEQNRIANEIHDSILQRLFIASCGVSSLMKRYEELETHQVYDQLTFMRDTLKNIMKDLRKAIYGLSWQKNGTDNFTSDIRERINEICNLSGTKVNFSITGDTSLLPASKKKAVYRIICESIGNSVHHGKAGTIGIDLSIGADETVLDISDDGIGFNMDKIKLKGNEGLGIHNVYQLVYFLNGKVHYDSKVGKGTRIEIAFTNNQNYREQIV